MFFAALALALSAQAQQATGVIKGRVSNAGTGQYLRSAVIAVDGTGIKIKTDEQGNYVITDLAPGVYTLVASFTGLDTEKKTVEVKAAGELSLDFDLGSEIYVLGQYVVAAEREGSAKAIQEQREANSIKNVVASDSFGNMVDGNIGELMKNLPGVTIDYADGEDASAMRIRGMDPAMMSVTMNGNAIASNAQSTSRAFSLSDLAVQNIEEIEVNLAPTPDVPANSQGGSVNFKTKSAFSQKGRRIRLDGNLSMNSAALDFQKSPGGQRTPDRKIKPGFNLSYSEAFGKIRPIGVSLNVGMAQRYRFNYQYDLPGGYAYDLTQLDAHKGTVAPDIYATVPSLRWYERGQANDRWFASLALEWKVFDSTTLFVNSSYTYDKGIGNYQHEMRVNSGSGQDSNANFNTISTTAGSSIAMTSTVSNVNTRTWNLNPGVKHRFGNFELNYDAYISKSSYQPDKEQNYSVGYGIDALGLRVDNVATSADAVLTQTNKTATNDYLVLNNYKGLSLTQNFATGTDTQLGAKIDGKKPLELFGMPVILQAGGRATESERVAQRYYRLYKMTGNKGTSVFNTAAEPKLGQFYDVYFTNKWSFDNAIPFWISPYRIWDYLQAAPDKFYTSYLDLTNLNTTQQSDYVRTKEGDRYSRERIYAGYGMATLQPFRSLTVMAGARYELTELKGKGWLLDSTDRPFNGAYPTHKFSRDDPASPYYGIDDWTALNLILTKQKRTKVYDKVFPNVQVKYEPIKDLIVRGAFTTGMARPDLDYIMPGDRIYDHQNLIRRKNTKLLPSTSENIDFRLEYYLPRQGSISVGVFKQTIENWVYNVITSEYRYSAANDIWEPWTIETAENAGHGSNKGFEIQYRQRLGWVAKWLNDFEFYAAFSAADPKAQYLKRTGDAVYEDNPDPAKVDAYMNSLQIWQTIVLPDVIKKSANARISYTGKRFSATFAGYWRDSFARNVNITNGEIREQAADLRFDVSSTWKLSPKWKAYLDWRNITNVADNDKQIFGRAVSYYKSGMVINLGLRADL
ncbi:MAG: TonB-dependent receptor [Nibricoccus sp.]